MFSSIQAIGTSTIQLMETKMNSNISPISNSPSDILSNDGDINTYIYDIAKGFQNGVGSLGSALTAAQQALEANPSDPAALASYQAVLSDYTIFRNAQSSAVKAMKDIDTTILGNLR